MRLKEREISDKKEIEKFLQCSPVGRIGLVLGTQPYVVPVHFVYEDGKIFIHSANVGMKMECVKANSRVCFETDEFQAIIPNPNPCSFETKYRSVIAFGTAKILIGKDIKLRMLRKIISKYGGIEESLTMNNVEKYVSSAGSSVDVIEIQIEELTGKMV